FPSPLLYFPAHPTFSSLLPSSSLSSPSLHAALQISVDFRAPYGRLPGILPLTSSYPDFPTRVTLPSLSCYPTYTSRVTLPLTSCYPALTTKITLPLPTCYPTVAFQAPYGRLPGTLQ